MTLLDADANASLRVHVRPWVCIKMFRKYTGAGPDVLVERLDLLGNPYKGFVAMSTRLHENWF